MASYVILLRPGWDGVEIDSMLDVSMAIVGPEAVAVAKVCDRIDGVDKAYRALAHPHKDVCHAVMMLELRTRCDGACDGPFVLHSEDTFTRDELEQHLRDNPELVQRLRRSGRL